MKPANGRTERRLVEARPAISFVFPLVLLMFVAMVAAVLPAADTPAAVSPGEVLFQGRCAMCHGPDGAGKTLVGEKLKIRDLRSEAVQKQTDAELNQIVTSGRGRMAAYQNKLTGEQIAQVVTYIRDLGKQNPRPPHED
jgi:mono/diheme cytochrome c family protein